MCVLGCGGRRRGCGGRVCILCGRVLWLRLYNWILSDGLFDDGIVGFCWCAVLTERAIVTL